MSEYWKSTPKYWCKFCKIYVRDTNIDKQQHEATGKHQAGIQRSLRSLHRDQERESREKQRAKDEVARLNGIVSGTPSTGSKKPTNSAAQSSTPLAQASVGDRKLQMKQLADLGVAIPDQYRGDLALPGQWETVSERIVEPIDSKPKASSYGVHKRKIDGDDEEDEEKVDQLSKRRADWGSRYRSYPGAQDDSSSQDIEALLKPASAQPAQASSSRSEEPAYTDFSNEQKISPASAHPETSLDGHVKDEAPDQTSVSLQDLPKEPGAAINDTENIAPVVFKKRKAKVAKVI